MSNIAKAIKSINNNAEFSIENEDINKITWWEEYELTYENDETSNFVLLEPGDDNHFPMI